MCLIITGQSDKIRNVLLNTHGLLNNIYTSNPDGIGFMYGSSKGLRVVKTLPRNVKEAYNFIGRMPNDDREMAIHFRWTTHGHTDLNNCHPYDVLPGYVAMMHNGVLHTGNAQDTSRSDTYHFIQDYLADAVSEHPPIVHNIGFLTMVAEFIGDNRFVFMDGEGRMSHVNYDQGIEHDGLWFSNTYAWSPRMLIPNYYVSSKYGKTSWKGHLNDAYYDEDEHFSYGGWGGLKHDDPVGSITKRTHEMTDAELAALDDGDDTPFMLPSVDELGDMLLDADVENIELCFESFPITTINMIMANYRAMPAYAKPEDMSDYEAEIMKAALDGDTAALQDFVRDGRSAGVVAEVFCYYLHWSYHDLIKRDEEPSPV